MTFITDNTELFQTYSEANVININHRHALHRANANLATHKKIYYSGKNYITNSSSKLNVYPVAVNNEHCKNSF
jgi:hypothetical protein